jgi:hypothetical protein
MAYLRYYAERSHYDNEHLLAVAARLAPPSEEQYRAAWQAQCSHDGTL